MVQSVKCLLYKHEDLSLVLGTYPFKIAKYDDAHDLSFGEEGTRGFLDFLNRDPNLIGKPRSP